MDYGPGASVALWRKVFEQNKADIWFAELDQACVERHKSKLSGIGVVVGDQGDKEVLNSWVRTTKGKFDVIIDDGGHKNTEIMATIDVFWPELNPGGFYFIEDLQMGRHQEHMKNTIVPPVTNIIQAWVDYLNLAQFYPRFNPPHLASLLQRYPMPQGIDWISCQNQACVLHKAEQGTDLS
jgi:hypothetical protein